MASPTTVKDPNQNERAVRDATAEGFFNAYRFDDILPLRLEIVDERKEKSKKSVVSANFPEKTC